MKKWHRVIVLCFITMGVAFAYWNRSEAAAVVTVSLPEGASTEYKIGETITLKIVFNEKVNMSAGAIPAGVDGNGNQMKFNLEGASPGEFRQVYEAVMTVLPEYPNGKIQLGNLQGVAITSDGKSYYDSTDQTVQYDTVAENITIDTLEIEWNPKVFVSDKEVTESGYSAERGEMIRVQLFSMNVGVNGPDYYGEYQGLELNGTGQWMTDYRFIPHSDDYRNGIHLNRYTYEFFYPVPQNVVLDPFHILSIVRDQPLNHNGKDFALILPDEVKTTIADLDLLADGRSPHINVDVTSDSEPKNRENRKVVVTASDESGIDALFYKWALEGSELDQYFWGFKTNGVASGNPVPILPEDVPADGSYYLYIRALDNAGNERTQKFGPYQFKVNVPGFLVDPQSGTRFKGDDIAQISVALDTLSVTESVYYSWSDQEEVIVPDTLLDGEGPWTIHDLPAGNHLYDLNLVFTDEFSNSTEATYTFIRDLYAPTVTGDVYGMDSTLPHQSVEIPLTINPLPGDATAEGDTYTVYQMWSSHASSPDVSDSGWHRLENPASAVSPAGLNGEHFLHIKAVDAVGNRTIQTIGGFLFDNTPPILNESAEMGIACSEQYYYPFINVDCTDQVSVDEVPRNSLDLQLLVDDRSDLTQYTIEYYVSNQPILAYKGKYPLSGWKIAENGRVDVSGYDGVRYLIFKITDPAGNSMLYMTDGYTFDDGGVTGEVHFEKNYTNQKSVMFIPSSAADDVTLLRYSFDGINFSEYMSFTADSSVSVDLPADSDGNVEEGVYTIFVQFKDHSGNESNTFANDTITYDVTPPSVDSVEMVEDDETGNVTSTVYYSDNFSPISDSVTLIFTENGTKDVEVFDEAGNITVYTVTVDQIDRTGPEIQFSPWGNMVPQQTAQTTVMVSDSQSGLDSGSLQYVWHNQNQLPNVGDISWQSFSSGDDISLSSVNGTWYLFIKASDLKGNEVIVRSDAFLLDNHPPEIFVSYSFNMEGQQQMPLKTAGPITATLKANHDQIIGIDYTFGKAFTVIKVVNVHRMEVKLPFLAEKDALIMKEDVRTHGHSQKIRVKFIVFTRRTRQGMFLQQIRVQ